MFLHMTRPERHPRQTSLWKALRAIRFRSIPQLKLRMPGKSHSGPLPPLTAAQSELATELKSTVTDLAIGIGQRNVFMPSGLRDAEAYLGGQLSRMGYKVRRQAYTAAGVECANLDVEIPGRTRPDEIVVIGAHYDSIADSPAANDNGSGVAATLAIARRFAAVQPNRTVRFVLFVNEEPPFFFTEDMGSHVYASACKARNENIVAMFTPETIGYYSDEPGSQRYPLPIGDFYPETGNFIAFIGMHESAPLIRQVVGSFRKHCKFPSIGAGLPSIVPMVGASDHWAFWCMGYQSLMVTDTAPFRYNYYHTREDTPDKLDYPRMARVVDGLHAVTNDLVY
jgi:Zn-dependent M28 family amino/carboxypeptidase